MKAILLGILVAFCLPMAVMANERSVISSYLTDLEQDITTWAAQLETSGYQERREAAFQQADVRVFIKGEEGTRPAVYILEQCNNKITGYTRPITSMDEVLLAKELQRLGYKKTTTINGERYRKGTITIDLYSDDSRLLLARRYIHLSKKNGCHTEEGALWLRDKLNLRPTNLEAALTNLKYKRNEVALAAAMRAFAWNGESDTAQTVTYKKSQQTFRINYCHNQVQRFELELNEKEGNGLVESVEKMNFQKLTEETAANNAFVRTYASEACEVTVYYYGDKYGREFNENAFKIVLLNKKTCI